MPLGTKVGLSPGDSVLDGDPAPYPKRGGAPPNFRPTSILTKRLHGSRCHLVRRYTAAYATLCSMWIQLPPEKGHTHPTQFLAYVYCNQMAGWMKTPLVTEVDLGPDHVHCTRRGPISCGRGTQQPPYFRPMSILWPRSPISATAELLLFFPYTDVLSKKIEGRKKPFLPIFGPKIDTLSPGRHSLMRGKSGNLKQ